MKKIIRLFFPLLAGVMFLTASCVRDGGTPCPNYLKIKYDYNMAFKDKFDMQVTFLSIFMFDPETGVLVREVRKTDSPFPENYTIEAPADWMNRTYDIMVWAGLDPDSYDFSQMIPGSSTITDFELKVKGYQSQNVQRSAALEPLWHGKLTNVFFADDDERTYTVSLTKDTKKFRLVVQPMNADLNISAEDLDISLLSADGWYDNENTVLDPLARTITYRPYYAVTDPDVGAIAEMNSLRLMDQAGRVNKLVIKDKITGAEIIDLSLMKYLNALRILEYSHIPFQQYLDRQDEYYILVLLQQAPSGTGWLSAEIYINDWLIRLQEI